MAYMGASIGVSSLYAPVLGFWLSNQYGFEATFIFSSATALLGALLALRLSSSRINRPPSETSAEKVPISREWAGSESPQQQRERSF